MFRSSFCSTAMTLAILSAAASAHALTPMWKSVEAMEDVHFATRHGYTEGAEFRVERLAAPGVRHVFEAHSEGPLTHNILFIDTSREDLSVEVEKGKGGLGGQEPLPDIIERLMEPDARPVAAINGDFWGAGGIPIGLFIDEGTIWRSTYETEDGRRRSVFAFDATGNLFIGQPDFTMMLATPEGDQELTIDRVNVGAGDDTTIVYTWPKGDAAPEAPEGFSQAVLRLHGEQWLPNAPATVTVESTAPEIAALGTRTVVLHAPGALPEWITEGAELTLKATLDNLPGMVTGVVGGGPRLVADGVADPVAYGKEEAMGDTFVTDRHPRTAIGLLADGKTVVCVVTDGRQPRKSIGTDLIDLAEYMKSLGCVQALNLDGGGSSTMWASGDLVNFPSDGGGARSVSNAIVFRRTAPLGPPKNVEVVPSGVLVPEGGMVDLYLRATDRAGEQVSLEDWDTYFIGRDESLPIDELARVTFPASGAFEVLGLARRGDSIITSAPTTFEVEKPAEFIFSPKALLLSEGESVEVTIKATTEDGRAFYRNTLLMDLEVPDFLEFDQKAHQLTATGTGAGVIRARLGDIEATLPVAVDQDRKVLLESFDALPADDMTDWLDLLRADEEKTSVTLDKERTKQGEASWRLDYAMTPGGASRILLPLGLELPGDPLAVGLWVYGDGNQHWLRGELEDAAGSVFYLDFTTSREGVNWKDKWKFVRATLVNPTLLRGTTSVPKAPMTMRNLYIVQPQEAAKTDGTLWLDGLVALDLPEGILGSR